MKKFVYFDLDGTLSDSAPGIYNGIRYAQKKFGLREMTQAELQYCVGPPMPDSFMKIWGIDRETGEKVLAAYREYYAPKGIFENSLYPGVKEALEELKKNGTECGICSAKPEKMVFTVLEHFGIREYFSVIRGADITVAYPGKAEVLKSLIQKNPAQSIMVGDRASDISGAHGAGITAIGAAWGYGGKDELLNAHADIIASAPAELPGIIAKIPDIV